MTSLITFLIGDEVFALEVDSILSVIDVHDTRHMIGSATDTLAFIREDWPAAIAIDLNEILQPTRSPMQRSNERFFVVKVGCNTVVFLVDKVCDLVHAGHAYATTPMQGAGEEIAAVPNAHTDACAIPRMLDLDAILLGRGIAPMHDAPRGEERFRRQ